MEWSSNPAAGKNTKLERVSQKKLNSRRLQKYSGGKFVRQDSVCSKQDPWSCPPEVGLGGLHRKGQHDGEVANRLEQSLRQAACPSPPAGRELGRGVGLTQPLTRQEGNEVKSLRQFPAQMTGSHCVPT